jgi:hypothetical protein
MLATIVRQASIDETAAEMDRRGKVIEALERRLTLRDTYIVEKGLWHEFATTVLAPKEPAQQGVRA